MLTLAKNSSVETEIYLRHRDLIAYPLRKKIHSLNLGIRYDNTIEDRLRLQFRSYCGDTSLIKELLVSKGFSETGSDVLKKGVSESGISFNLCCLVTAEDCTLYRETL